VTGLSSAGNNRYTLGRLFGDFGLSRQRLAILPAVLIAIALFAIPIGYESQRQKHARNFRVVKDGVLYRSGQLTPAGLERLIHDYGIRTVVSFRYAKTEGQEPPDRWEEGVCARLGINYVRIQPRVWVPDEKGVVPADEGVNQFLGVLAEPRNRPVLVHCLRGVHRTGSYCAIFRMDCQGWSNADALTELEELGYDNLENEDDVRGYLEHYVSKRHRGTGK
jgi:protein tyrosine/serine phosphatase